VLLVADTYLDGPFRVLRRCFLERLRVLVVVRRINSVRGTCSGFLKAFDKHMNLVLLDATQEFVPLHTHERLLREVRDGNRSASDAVFSSADRRRNRRVLASAGGTQREYVKQLFIRGDNVVSVSAVTGNGSGNRPRGANKQRAPRS
jgi:small nuclear ribonucleoprotein (snRNP)-like protein